MKEKDNLNKVWRWLALAAVSVGCMAGTTIVHLLYVKHLNQIVIGAIIFFSFLTIFAIFRAVQIVKK